MIRPHTLDEIPRGDPREHLRDRARRGGRLRLPEQRRAFWIGGGSISIPGDPLGSAAAAPFNGQFASLFPGAYQVLQSDLGLSYGAVMRADPANTSSVALALTGATPSVPVPIWIRITAPGVGNVYYDGLGVTPAMVGVTIVDSVNIVLTGAGLGMAITPGVGSQVAGDTWRSTCSGLADQSANGKNAANATPAAQPIVTAGYNGKVGLLFDGVDDMLRSNPAPLITALPFQVILVGRFLAPGSASQYLLGTTGFCSIIQIAAANTAQAYNATNGFSIPFASANQARFSATFTGSNLDVFLAGSGSRTGFNAGASVPNVSAGVYGLGGAPVFSIFSNVEILACILTPPTAIAPFDAAINSAQGYGPGAILV